MNQEDKVAKMTETTFAEKSKLYLLFDEKREIAELVQGLRSFSRKRALDNLLASQEAIMAYALQKLKIDPKQNLLDSLQERLEFLQRRKISEEKTNEFE